MWSRTFGESMNPTTSRPEKQPAHLTCKRYRFSAKMMGMSGTFVNFGLPLIQTSPCLHFFHVLKRPRRTNGSPQDYLYFLLRLEAVSRDSDITLVTSPQIAAKTP